MFMNRYPFKGKAPNPKFQAPKKLQVPSSNGALTGASSGACFRPKTAARWQTAIGAWRLLRPSPTKTALILGCLLASTRLADAFCGFYVCKADTTLFNKASQVVLVRHEDKTVLTMANDYQGDPKEFAIVIPVPTFIEKEQIHIGEKALLDHLDGYSSPRLVEYHDPDPCIRYQPKRMYAPMASRGPPGAGAVERA